MQEKRLSLRYKFLLLTTTILCASVLAYLLLAVQLFDRDKTAYIYDNNAALVETLAEESQAGLMSSIKTMRLIGLAALESERSGAAESPTIDTLFKDDDQLVELTWYNVNAEGEAAATLDLVNEAYLKPYDLTRADFTEQLAKRRVLPIDLIRARGLHFEPLTLGGKLPLLSLALAMASTADGPVDRLVVASLRQDRRLEVFRRSGVYTTYLIDGEGHVLAHSDPQKVLDGASLASSSLVRQVLNGQVVKGAQESSDENGVKRIVAYKKLGIGQLVAFSEIPVEKAFLASRRLVEKTGMFAVLILAVSFLVTILFTQRLTAALQNLYAATLRIAQGRFDVEVDVRTRDEVGALSASFNRMAREIQRLLVETRDKARMEKELETAQLVQDNFFPRDHLRVGDFEIAAYFKPASECGGDWWGSIQLERELILLVGDATGHGVPAALMTATAHSCTATLARLSQTMQGLRLTPAFIMDHLNAAIFHAGQGRIKMTFFVAVIDLDTGQVTYANASHDAPIVVRAPEGRPPEEGFSRADVDTLGGQPSACLGQDLSAHFGENRSVFRPGETFVWYTDGLTEGRNPGDEEFGEGRLVRSLVKVAARSAVEIRDELIGSATRFFGERQLADDLTLIVVKRAASADARQLVG